MCKKYIIIVLIKILTETFTHFLIYPTYRILAGKYKPVSWNSNINEYHKTKETTVI